MKPSNCLAIQDGHWIFLFFFWWPKQSLTGWLSTISIGKTPFRKPDIGALVIAFTNNWFNLKTAVLWPKYSMHLWQSLSENINCYRIIYSLFVENLLKNEKLHKSIQTSYHTLTRVRPPIYIYICINMYQVYMYSHLSPRAICLRFALSTHNQERLIALTSFVYMLWISIWDKCTLRNSPKCF